MEFRAAREALVERVAETQGHIARQTAQGRRTYLRDLAEPFPWDAPTGTDPDQSSLLAWQQWIAEYVEHVNVGPAMRGRNFFDADRVKVFFRDTD